jgi:hypothetical protein
MPGIWLSGAEPTKVQLLAEAMPLISAKRNEKSERAYDTAKGCIFRLD